MIKFVSCSIIPTNGFRMSDIMNLLVGESQLLCKGVRLLVKVVLCVIIICY